MKSKNSLEKFILGERDEGMMTKLGLSPERIEKIMKDDILIGNSIGLEKKIISTF